MGKTGDLIDSAIAKQKSYSTLKSQGNSEHPNFSFNFERENKQIQTYPRESYYKKCRVKSGLPDSHLKYIEKAINVMSSEILLKAAEIAGEEANTAAALAKSEAEKVLKTFEKYK